MGLPAGRFAYLIERGTLSSAQQRENGVGLGLRLWFYGVHIGSPEEHLRIQRFH